MFSSALILGLQNGAILRDAEGWRLPVLINGGAPRSFRSNPAQSLFSPSASTPHAL